MLSVTGYRLMLWTQPADMRTGAHGLSGIVCNEIKEDPFLGGTIYVFFNARRTTVKMIIWDMDGFAMYYKRLSRGTFGMPVYDPGTKSMVIERKDLQMILEGIEVRYRKRYKQAI